MMYYQFLATIKLVVGEYCISGLHLIGPGRLWGGNWHIFVRNADNFHLLSSLFSVYSSFSSFSLSSSSSSSSSSSFSSPFPTLQTTVSLCHRRSCHSRWKGQNYNVVMNECSTILLFSHLLQNKLAVVYVAQVSVVFAFPPRFWRGKACSQYEVSSCHTVLRTQSPGKSPSCLFLNVSMTVIDMCTHVCIRQPPCKDDGRFCIYVSEFSRRKRWRLILWSSYATKTGHVYIFTWTVCRGWAITKYCGRIDAIKSETE